MKYKNQHVHTKETCTNAVVRVVDKKCFVYLLDPITQMLGDGSDGGNNVFAIDATYQPAKAVNAYEAKLLSIHP